ncbi:hypothetical protein ABZX12_39880 [Kribbella sp. NPDC003505]|uniref:hypothetical protein n=1 Tax=Kribbella sp. NPDC003505 TaxID=3154448 RepID=UPI0033A944E1
MYRYWLLRTRAFGCGARKHTGEYVERENDDNAPWQTILEDDESFWLHHAAFEALWFMEASRSALHLDRAAITQIEEQCSPLPCGSDPPPTGSQRVRMLQFGHGFP